MPDWAYNELTIIGPEDRVRAFLAENRGEQTPLTFTAALPYPEVFREQDRIVADFARDHPGTRADERPKDGYNDGGYEWCLCSWGTKWDACDPVVIPGPAHINVVEATGLP
jgi:hypothetical protein